MFGTKGAERWRIGPDEEGFSQWETDLERLFFVDVAVAAATYAAFNHPREIEDPMALIKWRIAFSDGVVPGKGLWADVTARENMSTS